MFTASRVKGTQTKHASRVSRSHLSESASLSNNINYQQSCVENIEHFALRQRDAAAHFRQELADIEVA
jgi:hypothetical protein